MSRTVYLSRDQAEALIDLIEEVWPRKNGHLNDLATELREEFGMPPREEHPRGDEGEAEGKT